MSPGAHITLQNKKMCPTAQAFVHQSPNLTADFTLYTTETCAAQALVRGFSNFDLRAETKPYGSTYTTLHTPVDGEHRSQTWTYHLETLNNTA